MANNGLAENKGTEAVPNHVNTAKGGIPRGPCHNVGAHPDCLCNKSIEPGVEETGSHSTKCEGPFHDEHHTPERTGAPVD